MFSGPFSLGWRKTMYYKHLDEINLTKPQYQCQCQCQCQSHSKSQMPVPDAWRDTRSLVFWGLWCLGRAGADHSFPASSSQLQPQHTGQNNKNIVKSAMYTESYRVCTLA